MKGGAAGFTLLELLVVLLIAGLIMALAVRSLSNWRNNTAVTNAAMQLAADIQDARSTAKLNNVCKAFSRVSTTSYTITTYTTPNCSGTGTSTSKSMLSSTLLALGTVSGAVSPASVNFRPPYGTSEETVQYVITSARTGSISRTVRVTGVLGKVIIK